MTAEVLVVRFLREVWDAGRPERAAEFIDAEYDLGGLGRGPAACAANVRDFRLAFPDLRLRPIEMISDDRRVAVWMRLSGTHEGMFRGYPPSGHRALWDEVGFFTVARGKIVAGRFLADMFGLRKAIGVIDREMP